MDGRDHSEDDLAAEERRQRQLEREIEFRIKVSSMFEDMKLMKSQLQTVAESVSRIPQLQTQVTALVESVTRMDKQIVILETNLTNKASTWGLISGAIPGLIIAVVWYIQSMGK